MLLAAVSGATGGVTTQIMDDDAGLLRRLNALEETVDDAFEGEYEELDIAGDAATDFEYFNELNGLRRRLAGVHEDHSDHEDDFGFGPIEASAMPILQALTITRFHAQDQLLPRVQNDPSGRDAVESVIAEIDRMGEMFGGIEGA